VSVVRVDPGPVRGTVRPPSSKSYTHRALIAGHLSGRHFSVDRPLRSDDTVRTARALEALGSRVRFGPRRWTLTPRSSPSPLRPRAIECGESGTTLRFLSAVAARTGRPVELRGGGRLPQRPMAPLVDALRQLGAQIELPAGGRSLPMRITGPLRGGRVVVDPSESSQFVSALLLVLPTVAGSSEVRLVRDPVSAPYIAATLAVLRAEGVRIVEAGRTFRIHGPQSYRGRAFRVPGDASSAAYLWAAAAVSGGSVTVLGLPDHWPQADLAVLPLLRRFGARIAAGSRGTRVQAGRRRAFSFDLTDSPDLYPLAGVLAACVPETSRLIGGAQVAAKESDRRAETIALARAMGARVEPRPNELRITGRERPSGFSIRTATDHRVVMSAAVGALAGDRRSTIGRREAVAKSFPDFWTVLARIGAGVSAT